MNYDQPGYYDGPYLGVHTLDGQLLRVSGKRAESYQAHHIPYVHTVNVAVDSFRERILVSQPASHTWEVYDLDGELIAQYGKPGQYIADQEWPDFNGTVSKARQRFIDLKYNTPEYGFLCALGSEYVIRSYRRGVADHEGLVNFLDKPHYLQVYDADGTLLADDPAPDFSFMPVGVEDGALWVNLARSYDVEEYTYTLYRYRLVVEAK